MAVQGKKINELTAIGTVSDETVLPAVYVSGTTVNSTANKISIEQISTKVQDDMSTALAGKQDTLVSGTNIKTINNESLLGSGNLDVDGLPSQTGQSGKFLTTDGTNASWAQVSTPESGADTSLSNLTATGKEVAATMSMPSSVKVALSTSGSSGSEYTAPADGYFYISTLAGNSTTIRMTTPNLGTGGSVSNSNYGDRFFLPVAKGDVMKLEDSNGNLLRIDKLYFVYAKGSEPQQ